MNYSYDYICEPRRITIIAKSTPLNSRGIYITFYVDNKEAHTIYSRLHTYTPSEDDINSYVSNCCDRLRRLSEEKIQDACEEDKIMLMLYLRKHLSKVEKRSGTIVWRL